MYIDIPDGEKYGFPKRYEYHEGESIRDWLLRNGCPEKVLTNMVFPSIISNMIESEPKQFSFDFDGETE